MALQSLLLVGILRLMHRLVSPDSDDPFFLEYTPFRQHDMSSLISAVLNSLIGYTIGRVVATLLILESELAPSPSTSDLHPQQPLLTRSPIRTLAFLRQTGALHIVCRGFTVGAVYHIVLHLVTSLAGTVAPAYTRPLLEIVSAVLLSELHLLWTHAMVMAHRRVLQIAPDRRRWTTLFWPALVQASAAALLRHLPQVVVPVAVAWSSRSPQATVQLAVFGEVLTIALQVLVRGGLLIPATVALTLVEASFLDEREATIVPAVRERRRAKMEDLVGGRMRLVRRAQLLQPVYGLVRWNTFAWMVELHVWKGVVEFGVEGVVWVVSLWS